MENAGRPSRGHLAEAILVVAAFLAAVVPTLSRSYFYDEIVQIDAARSLLAGHGLTELRVSGANLSVERYRPVVDWPPAYSLLSLIPLELSHDLWITRTALDVTTTAMVVLAWFLILRELRGTLSRRARLVLWALWVAAAPLVVSAWSNSLALGLYSMAIWMGLRACRSGDETRGPWRAALAGLFGAAAALSRYLYVPLLAVVPICLLVCSPRPVRFRLAGVSAAAGTVVWGVCSWLSLRGALDVFPVPKALAAWTLEPLRDIHPFPIDALGTAAGWARSADALYRWLSWTGDPRALLWTLGVLVVAIAALPVVHRAPRPGEPNAAMRFLRFAGVLTAALTVGAMAYLDGARAPVYRMAWTFTGQPRYYELIRPLLGVAWVAAWIDGWTIRSRPARWLRRSACTACAILALVAAGVNAAWMRIELHRQPDWIDEAYRKPFADLVASGATPDEPSVYVERRSFPRAEYRAEFARFAGVPAITLPDQKISIRASRPIRLIVGFPSDANKSDPLVAWSLEQGRSIGSFQGIELRSVVFSGRKLL